MRVTLTECTKNPILSIERAAANCYDSSPNSNGKIMNGCYESGHQSVFEFAYFTFHITGVSRALTHQLVRHRQGVGYAQRSQRYCEEDGFDYVIPPKIAYNEEAAKKYSELMRSIQDTYYELKNEYGIPAEDARYVLPNACETVIEVTMNGRELIHFCNMRMCSRAQWEIRKLANEMKKSLETYNSDCAEFAKFLVPKCKANPNYPFCTERKCCGLSPKLSAVYNTMVEYELHID